MKNLTKFALMRPVTMLLALVTVLYFGLQGVFGSPMELTPDINFPMMIIYTTFPGAGPEDIVETICKPLENSVSTLSGIRTYYSYGMENVALMMLRYEYGTNMDTAYLDLRKQMDIAQNSLPDDVGDVTIMEMDMNAMPVMQLMIRGGTDGNLRSYVNDEILPELEKISSVAEATVNGGRESYIRIELDRAKMEQYGLTMDTLAQLIGAADFTIPSGSIDHGDQSLNVSTGASYKSVEAIKTITLPLRSGEVIQLSDVATVYDKLEDRKSVARYDGEDIVTVSVSKQQSASAVDVSRAVRRTFENLKQKNPTLNMEIIRDSADNIKDSLKGVFQTLALAVVLAMLILFIFFGDLKASLIVGTSIPVSVMVALCCMSAMGFSMNLISVGSLVLGVGMVVDNSIVVLDSCFRQKTVRRLSYYEGALEGSEYVLGSIAGSTATTCVVFLPLALLTGLSGQLFSQLGFTIVFCMLASLLSACTIVPLLFYFLHPQEKKEAPVNRVMKGIENWYRNVAAKILPRTRTTILVVILLLATSFVMAGRLGMELQSEIDEGQISVTVNLKPGQDIEKISNTLLKVEEIISADPDVDDYLVSYGSSGVGYSLGSSSATVTAYLKDRGFKKPRKRTTDQVIADWKTPMQTIPDASITMAKASSSSMSSSTSADVECDLQGADLDLVKGTADDIVEALQQEPYVTKVHSSMENGAPRVKVDVDPVKAQAEGLTPAGIAGGLYTSISGKEVMSFTVDAKEYKVRLEYPDDTFASIDELKGWLLTTPAGRKIPLSDVAKVSLEDSPQTLLRKDKRYYVQITAQIVEEYKKTAEEDMKSFVENWQKPIGVESVPNAQDESMKEELGNLGNALITAIFLVFVVMAVQFESIKFSFMVMFTIPFSLIGSFGLLFLADCKISMVSMIGFLMLVGTVVNNGILYVDTATHLRSENGDLDRSLVEAGAIRLRPIFMTTLTTIIAMVPMALRVGKAGQYMQGLALVNVGGLIASTLLSLLLLPVLYRMMSQYRKKPDELVDVD
ncbi:MAG: efflux RND transporter permease subunit [Stomatobaculum sp.]|nr:efflux RND transporter permease subunit [Stomatobaculum sp.]